MPQIASEPWPSCQTSSSTPHAAATLMTFRITAFSGSSSERNARASRTNVIDRDQRDHQREVAVDGVDEVARSAAGRPPTRTSRALRCARRRARSSSEVAARSPRSRRAIGKASHDRRAALAPLRRAPARPRRGCPSPRPRAAATALGRRAVGTSTSFGSSAPEPMPELLERDEARPWRRPPWRSCSTFGDARAAGSSPRARAPRARRARRPPRASGGARRRCAQRVQARDGLVVGAPCGQSSRGPSVCSTTGSSVSATSTLISGISMPP